MLDEMHDPYWGGERCPSHSLCLDTTEARYELTRRRHPENADALGLWIPGYQQEGETPNIAILLYIISLVYHIIVPGISKDAKKSYPPPFLPVSRCAGIPLLII